MLVLPATTLSLIHISPLQLGGLFHICRLGASLGKTPHYFLPKFGMAHFPAAETDRNLHLVAVLQETQGVIQPGVEIVYVNICLLYTSRCV